MELTSPDNIAKWTIADAASLVQASQAQGDSTQYALDNRQRYDYVWPTSAERTAQLGMVQGSRGYQVNTKSEYIYDNSNWRLSISYIEYTGTSSMTSVTWCSPNTLAVNNTNTTDSSMASITLGGTTSNPTFVTLVNPGVYSLSWTSVITGNVGAIAQFSPSSSTSVPLSIVNSVTNNTNTNFTVIIPFLRTTASNTPVYLWMFQNVAGTPSQTGTVRIGRFG